MRAYWLPLIQMLYSRSHDAKAVCLIALAMVIMITPFTGQALTHGLTVSSEYGGYVQTSISTTGNYTYVEKPVFPVLINDSQIPVSENWTIVCALQAQHNYHVYFYGAYLTPPSTTDYYIYVYDPKGNLESSHLQSTGFEPHLGTTINSTLFTPTESGNYSFVIYNNQFGSQGAKQATFMIIENLPTDQWCNAYLEGLDSNNLPKLYTSWAYEFATSSPKIQVFINVPTSLDVFETRLYLMNDGTYQSIDSYPLAWEPGLYGNVTGSVGGYNLSPNGYTGVAYASDEYSGQELILNFNSNSSALSLYHLVLIGDVGHGNLQIMIKTNFTSPTLTPTTVLSRVYPGQSTQISYVSNASDLQSAQLSYSLDNWNSTKFINMQISKQTCTATIPAQPLGTIVQYQINATDILENSLTANGSYAAKDAATLNITLTKTKVMLGQNVTIRGTLTPGLNNSNIQIQFVSANAVETTNATTKNGLFIANCKLNETGTWQIMATLPETQTAYSADSLPLMVTVTPPPIYVKYSLFFLIGFVAVIAVPCVIYFIRKRHG